MKKKSIILAATSALAVLTLAACSGDTNKDIATMKGGTITVSDFYDEAKLESSNQSLVQRMIIYKVFNNKYGDKVTDKQVDAFSKLAKDKSTDSETKEDGGKVKFDSTTTTIPAEVKEAAFKLKDGEVSDVITATNTTSYATEYYVVKMVKNQNKGNDMDKYKDQLKEIATETKLSDNTFTTKVIGEELKDANVKIKDDAFENVLSEKNKFLL